MKDHRKFWPSKALNASKLFEALESVPNGFFCRELQNTTNPGNATIRERIESGRIFCPVCGVGTLCLEPPNVCSTLNFMCVSYQCRERFDAIDLATWRGPVGVDSYGVDITIRWMEQNGVFTSKRASSLESISSYRRYRASYTAFCTLQKFLKSQRINPSNSALSAAHHLFNFDTEIWQELHISNVCYTTTIGTVSNILGNSCDPNNGLATELHAKFDNAVLVIPATYCNGGMVGAWFGSSVLSNGLVRWVWRGVIDGPTGRWYKFKSDSDNNHDSTLQTHIITRDPTSAIVPLLKLFRNESRGHQVTLLGPGKIRASDITPSDNRRTIVVINDNNQEDIKLAADLNCRVMFSIYNDNWLESICNGLDGIKKTKFWSCELYYLYYREDNRQNGTLVKFLRLANWNDARAEQVVGCGHININQAKQLTEALENHHPVNFTTRTIEVRRGLTVVVTSTGWIWDENGALLMAAVPIIERIYRGYDRRVRYAGYVSFCNKSYPFDSHKFRRDPCAVIESAILRTGDVPPKIHPAIVPHIASVACYLRRTTR